MTHIEQAIKEAHKIGYRKQDIFYAVGSVWGLLDKKQDGDFKEWHWIVLDPLFWKALGQARGWIGPLCSIHSIFLGGKYIKERQSCENCKKDAWKQRWHRFIDHLAEGKDAESFFEGLIK